eukprot:2742660-Amphidinium_carterae.1
MGSGGVPSGAMDHCHADGVKLEAVLRLKVEPMFFEPPSCGLPIHWTGGREGELPAEGSQKAKGRHGGGSVVDHDRCPKWLQNWADLDAELLQGGEQGW